MCQAKAASGENAGDFALLPFKAKVMLRGNDEGKQRRAEAASGGNVDRLTGDDYPRSPFNEKRMAPYFDVPEIDVKQAIRNVASRSAVRSNGLAVELCGGTPGLPKEITVSVCAVL